MKKMLAVAILALAPAAYAHDDVSVLEQDEWTTAEADASEMVPPRDRRGVAVRCETSGGRFRQGRGVARGFSYVRACNEAAREAFRECSGRGFFAGPFRACGGGGGGRFDDFGRRGMGRSCMTNMRCNVIRRD